MNRTAIFLFLTAFVAPSRAPLHAQNTSLLQDQFAQNQPSESPSGMVFLASLQGVLSTKDDKPGKKFKVITLDPIRTADGRTVSVGSEIRGHIDKVSSAHQIGRGRLWVTFDDIKTPNGWIPIVATVSDVPGVYSVRVNTDKEGEIEARSGKRQEDIQAAIAGAFGGAGRGVASRNPKEAALGAAAGAATAYLIESGLSQDVTLEKRTKLEITLERPIYLSNE